MEEHIMPMRRIPMEKIREIIRLKETANLSDRAIARALNISRPVIKQYFVQIKNAGLNYDAIKDMDDDTLVALVQDRNISNSQRYKIISSQFDYLSKELKRTGVTLHRLWQEYLAEYPDGYGYSQFCYHFQQWRNSSELTMHIHHKAGDKMFVDFTGKHLEIVDRHTGEIKEVEVFVAVLGASQHTYVEATISQKKEDWIKANQNALYYFGGVPKAIVPDCLKSAVNIGNKYEPDINPEYIDFARHFQTTILPARPNAPKDKALVEGAVKIVYAWIFASLRNRIFHTLEELNQAIMEELEKYNSKPMQKLKVSRKALFDETEKAALRDLPKEKYTRRRFKCLKAQFNYHVYLSEDKHYYSVPYRYRGKQITVIYTDSIVELFFKNKRIAFHKRDCSPNHYTTVKEHMPSHHRFVNDWSPNRFISWAQKSGDHVKHVIEQVLAQRKHPEQAYKVCMGILGLEKKYTKERLNNACRIAIRFQYYSYRGIKRILENKMDTYQPEQYKPLPEHQNVRGQKYYNRENYHDSSSNL